MDRLECAQGSFQLHRRPEARDPSLRAWDAADHLLLDHLAEQPPNGSVLIVNDSFGALACGLADHSPTWWSDSRVASLAAEANMADNGLDPAQLTWVLDLDPAGGDPNGGDPNSGDLNGRGTVFDHVVMRVPRSHGLLEDQLHRLAPHVGPDTQLVATSMTRHLHTAALELFEGLLGPTRTSLARRKARLVHVEPDGRSVGPSPWPITQHVAGDRESGRPSAELTHHAGVFSADRIDQGAALFLDHLQPTRSGGIMVDLGCGNGVLGISASLCDPDLDLILVDESSRAVSSAVAGVAANVADHSVKVVQADALEEPDLLGVEPGQVDIVLCNPPFHTANARGDDTAWKMFTGAKEMLRPGGELVVVANRHLAHHASLSRVFGSSTNLAADPKYVVLSASKRAPR